MSAPAPVWGRTWSGTWHVTSPMRTDPRAAAPWEQYLTTACRPSSSIAVYVPGRPKIPSHLNDADLPGNDCKACVRKFGSRA